MADLKVSAGLLTLEEKSYIDALRQDNAALRADIAFLAGRLDALATKLNADGGVTDTNYATTNAAGLTSSTPLVTA